MLYFDKVIGDFFDRRMLRYWIQTLVIALVVLAPLMLWIGFGAFALVTDYAAGYVERSSATVEEAIWLSAAILSAIHVVVAVLLGGMLWIAFLHLFVMLSLFIIGFFTEEIIGQVRDKHYPGVTIDGGMSVAAFGLFMLKSLFKHLLLLLLLLPLLFFPAINGLVILFWFYSMYRSSLLADVAGTIFTREECRQRIALFEPRYYPPTVISYGASLVPLLNLVAPFLAVIWLSHIMLDSKEVSSTVGSERINWSGEGV